MNVAIWQKRINTGAFILSVCCVGLFLVLAFVPRKMELVFHLHPLIITLWLAVLTFFFGLIGFSGVTNGKRFVMSIVTVLITFILSALLLFILAVGEIMS